MLCCVFFLSDGFIGEGGVIGQFDTNFNVWFFQWVCDFFLFLFFSSRFSHILFGVWGCVFFVQAFAATATTSMYYSPTTPKKLHTLYLYVSYFVWMSHTLVVSGSVAGRTNLVAYFLYTSVMTGWIHPLVVHWFVCFYVFTTFIIS